MNFSGVIASFATGSYTVTRRGATTVGSDGRADLASSSTFTIQASVQPLGGRELQRLGEGLRVAERRKLYTTTSLRSNSQPDVISIDGDSWEVENIARYDVLGNYYKVIVAKVGS